MRQPASGSTVPFITLPNWVNAAAHCGFNIRPIFDRLGIQTDLVHLEDATISLTTLGKLMEACVAHTRQHHFPFVLGESFAFDYLPDIATFLATSPTLREALPVLDWVRVLVNPLIDLRLYEQGDEARLVQHGIEQRRGGTTAIHFVESTFAAVLKFGRRLAPELEHDLHLELAYAAPPHAALYEAHLHLPVAFAQPASALCFPREHLDRPLSGGFPDLHGQAEQRVGQRLARHVAGADMTQAVQVAFRREPRLVGRGLERMADHLGVHPRTLQRRLREEGAEFAALQDTVRRQLALADLSTPGLDLETISERLGYSDRRSFSRAFKRWTGTTPARYRSGDA